jgi:xylan 1,4-beta-xylosidase
MLISRRELLKNVGVAGAYFAAASVLDGCRGVGVFDALSRSLSATHFTAHVREVIGPCDARVWGNIAFDPMYAATVAPEARPAWDMIRESKAFRYVRCHNTFSDAPPGATPEQVMGCRVYTEDRAGRPHFNFEYLDQVLEIWTGAGLKPILEMDFMPDALAEGDIIRNYGGGSINPPRDLNKWRGLIYETVAHLIQRYGRNEVRTWYFEIWNEPDSLTFFADGVSDQTPFTRERTARFLRMYDYFVDGALAADPEIKVGGPGLAHHEDFFKLFLEHITNGTNAATGKRGTRVDFISWHAYGSSTEVLAKNWARAGTARSYPELAKVELHHTEWGQELLPEDDRPNVRLSSEYDAAFLCRGLDNLFTHTAARVDLFARWGDLINGWRPLFRQFGTQLVALPIFHAYALLAKLGPERIAVDGMWPGTPVRAFATRRGHAQAQVVLYYFDEANQHSIGEARDVDLTVRGLPGANVSLTVSRVDRDHANVYRAWVSMGGPASPTAAQAAKLAARAKVTAESRVVRVEGGEANLSLALPPNGVVLVHVEPAADK